MEMVGTQISQDDRTSGCRSFGSNYHPCNQSRKISIGVMVDSLEKLKPKNTNENEAYVPGIEKTCRKLSSQGDINEREQSKAKFKVHQIDQERNTYPWEFTNATQPRKPTSEAVCHSKPTLDTSSGGSEFCRAAAEISANLQSNSDSLKKIKRVYGRMEGDEEEKERANGMPSATAQKVFVPEREVAKDKATRPEDRKQVLKMKLWEILGANSLPNKQDSEAPEMGGNNLHPEPDINQKCEAAVKPKHSSDTKRYVSQSPDHSIKRAVTRSLTRKKAVSKAPTTKTRNVRNSTNTKKKLEKNIFSFNDGQLGNAYDSLTGGAPKPNEKSLARKGLKSETHRISFLKNPKTGEVQPEIDTNKTIKGPEKTSSIGNSMRSWQKSPTKNHSVFGSENRNKENGFSVLLNNNIGGKGSKRLTPMFSFTENPRADDVQPALDISKTVKGANRVSSFGNTMTSSKNFPPRNSSRLIDAENGNQENGSSLSSATKRGRKGSKAEGDNINFPEIINAEEVQLAANTRKTTKDVEKDSSVQKRTRFYRTSPTEKCNKHADAENEDWEKDSSLSAKRKPANISQLRIPRHWVQEKDFVPFKNKTDTHRDLENSPFEVRTPAEALSSGSPSKANHEELDNQSSENCSFNSPVASTPEKYKPDAVKRTFNDAKEGQESPLMKSRPTLAAHDSEVYTSSPEKMVSESSKEGWETEAMSPEIDTNGNPEFILYPNKRLQSQENLQSRCFSTLLVSPEGLESNDGSQGSPQTNEENGLANAISLLALALQRVESKIKTVTSNKSTAVLMSVAEEVNLQLQNAESQFERDVGKLTSLNKSQRKQLETELEEQQEQLKVIYQKFKSDVNQHIQEHRSKVEVLQGEEKELRIFMGKRKASQKEVLKQLEKSIQGQLSDAETRISNVHKMGREKMLELKQALGKCLKEGMFG